MATWICNSLIDLPTYFWSRKPNSPPPTPPTPHSATAPSVPGPPHCRGLTITLRHSTLGRTPLDEWSVRCRDLYLTTQRTHNSQTSMPPAGFESTVSASEWSQTHALDRAVTGIGGACIVRFNWIANGTFEGPKNADHVPTLYSHYKLILWTWSKPIHSFFSLSYEGSTASCTASFPYSAIYYFLFQFPASFSFLFFSVLFFS